MPVAVLVLALLALAPGTSTLQVAGCALVTKSERFEGKLIQFVAYRLPSIETIDYSPFGCKGKIRIVKPVLMQDHRLPGEGAFQSRSGLMVPATRIKGRVRVVKAPAVGSLKATTFVIIDDATIKPAGYRSYADANSSP